MEKLPTELLEKIFLLLRRPDRLSAALVCKRWAKIVSASRFLTDVCLVFRVADLQIATPTLLDSCRQYANLKICDGKLSKCHAEFWTRIAGDLVSLQLEHCDISDADVFYAILEGCRKLQSLEIEGCGCVASLDLLGSECPKEICVAKVQQSLRNVRHLSLRNNRRFTDASFDQMLTLMPNITSLRLAGGSNLKSSPGVFRALDNGTMEFSSTAFTFQNVLVCMMRSKQEFVHLDFSCLHFNDEALIQILELYRESLTSLRLMSHVPLTARAYEAIGECSKLRLLSLNQNNQTADYNLERILTKTPDLEHLDVGFGPRSSSQTLRLIAQLKKLRYLKLNAYPPTRPGNWGIFRALTELQHLNLSYTDCDVKALRQLASLKDLRTLKLCHCYKLDIECSVIICDNFERLENLNVAFSSELTDDGVCKFHQLKNLRSLDITRSSGISERSLRNGLGASDMMMLSMGDCSWLTDGALVSIANHHVCLEYLNLSYCDQITDVGLISALRCLPRLRTLILHSCRSLTDQSLHALQDLCPHLRNLNVVNCAMSRDAKDLLAHLRPSLSLTG